MSARRDLWLIYGAGAVRSAITGLIGVVLGIHLYGAGYTSLQIGLIVGLGLAGSAVATVLISVAADAARRRTQVALSLLGGVGLGALALSPPFALFSLLAFAGMLNATGTDRSASYALDQAVIPGLVRDADRTWAIARYSLVLDAGGSLGALGAGLPLLLARRLDVPQAEAWRAVLLTCAGLMAAVAVLYLLQSAAVELRKDAGAALRRGIAPERAPIIRRLAALFALDALGGGLLTDALVAYWFFRRFGVAEARLGIVFFVIHVLNAVSHLGAAWLAKRIGLLNTMVFTHLPSSVFLLAVPLAPSFGWAVALLLCREALVEMDVPTRQSYVAALVAPEERTFASGVTNLVRNVCWAIGSAVGGLVMQVVAFSTPLVAGGGMKIVYDVLLFRSFRRIKPPEEVRAG